jgi:hypothetical protein
VDFFPVFADPKLNAQATVSAEHWRSFSAFYADI